MNAGCRPRRNWAHARFDVLRVLIAARGELVSKDEIMAAVWPGIVVEDNNLTVQMSALRRILVQESAEGSCIQTVAGRGYRFVPTDDAARGGSRSDSAAVSSNGGGRPPPRLSIVVLPFTNLRRRPGAAITLRMGLTEDLTGRSVADRRHRGSPRSWADKCRGAN